MARRKGSKNFAPTPKITRDIVNKLRDQALAGNALSASVYLDLEHKGYFNHLTNGEDKMKNTFNPMRGAKETRLPVREPTMPAPDANDLQRRSNNNKIIDPKEPVIDR